MFFKDEQILGILQSLNFLTDWKMLAFFFVIYLVIAFKKLSDVTNVSQKGVAAAWNLLIEDF